MSIITLDQLQAEHTRLGALIQQFSARQQVLAQFPVQVSAPDVGADEIYIGSVITPTTRYHTILLPGDHQPDTWHVQMAWAKECGGDLPNRIEQALLFAHAREHFEKTAYWSNEQRAEDERCAWYQDFGDGYQYYGSTYSMLRARAVRRLTF